MEWLLNPQVWMALITLSALEIVLGIDNIVFISIQAGKLPPHLQAKARQVGLALAMLTRLALLFSLSWLMGLTLPLFTVLNNLLYWDISPQVFYWALTPLPYWDWWP